MKQKKRLMLSLFLLMLGLLFIVGGTYALFAYKGVGLRTNSITTNGITFSYKEKSRSINLNEIMPMTDEQGMAQDNYFEFDISSKTNYGTIIPYYITVRKDSTSSDIDDAIRLYLTKVDGDDNEEEVALTNFDQMSQYKNYSIDVSKHTEKLIYNEEVDADIDYRQTYRLRIWIDYNTDFTESKYNNASFKLTVNVYSNGSTVLANASGIEKNTLNRVSAIRNTPNTDISNRTGNIYYVSNTGDDSNDGLSESTPIKTLQKVNQLLSAGTISDNSTILLKNGDVFDGQLAMERNNVLIGSYGDISKGKPTLTRSSIDGAKEGNWVEIKPNIWKYTLNNSDEVFSDNVGVIWAFCNKGNSNCSKSMSTINKTFEYTQMITTKSNYDEANIENKIDTILKNDLEFYHVGHPKRYTKTGKQIYLYSTSNPATRFDEIRFSLDGSIITTEPGHDSKIDNLKIQFAGSHAISGGSQSNLSVTNCEIGFTGGIVSEYNDTTHEAVRLGNAIEVYGSVTDLDGSSVQDGFVVDNNYIYQSYDAGPTFQYTTNDIAQMKKATFSNNVIEYNNYNIEYWEYSYSSDQNKLNQSYIENFIVENNIFRHAGEGVSQTRTDKGKSAHIKTWYNANGAYNVVKENFIIRNNTFAYQSENAYYFRTNGNNYPSIYGNTFYGYSSDYFGYNSNEAEPSRIKFNPLVINSIYPNNHIIVKDALSFDSITDSGTSNEVTWTFDGPTNTLNITGSGEMADYTEENKAPWYKYKDGISTINVGEDVTKVGNYAFYGLTYVSNFRIDSKNLQDFSFANGNVNIGNNYITYNLGVDSTGTKLTFGPNVTNIPRMLFKPAPEYDRFSNVTDVVFEGNKVKKIQFYSLANLKMDSIVIPSSVDTFWGHGIGLSDIYFAIIKSKSLFFSDWAMDGNSKVEKIIFGGTVKEIKTRAFGASESLRTLVIPHIDTPSTADQYSVQSYHTVTVYGDESTQTWVENMANSGCRTTIVYKPLSEYKSTITSNTNINAEVEFNGTYTFETDKKVKAYYQYTTSSGKVVRNDDVELEKNGNQYTISNIENDIYIEIK